MAAASSTLAPGKGFLRSQGPEEKPAPGFIGDVGEGGQRKHTRHQQKSEAPPIRPRRRDPPRLAGQRRRVTSIQPAWLGSFAVSTEARRGFERQFLPKKKIKPNRNQSTQQKAGPSSQSDQSEESWRLSAAISSRFAKASTRAPGPLISLSAAKFTAK